MPSNSNATLFVFETIEPNLNAITLMVQLSGIAATVVTLIAGTLSDKLGNRRSFISIGYLIWGSIVSNTKRLKYIFSTDQAI